MEKVVAKAVEEVVAVGEVVVARTVAVVVEVVQLAKKCWIYMISFKLMMRI